MLEMQNKLLLITLLDLDLNIKHIKVKYALKDWKQKIERLLLML